MDSRLDSQNNHRERASSLSKPTDARSSAMANKAAAANDRDKGGRADGLGAVIECK